MAQLKLAEQIITEKDQHLQSSEYRADMAIMEKEALEEEIMLMKNIQSKGGVSSNLNSPQHDSFSPGPIRVS